MLAEKLWKIVSQELQQAELQYVNLQEQLKNCFIGAVQEKNL